MTKKSYLILALSDADKDNLELVGEKAVILSEINHLGLNTPDGFIVTSVAFPQFLKENNLPSKIKALLSTIHFGRTDSLMQVSTHIKKLIANADIPNELINDISTCYKKLGGVFRGATVTVGGNKTPVKNIDSLITAIKKIWASQFDPKQLLQMRISNNRHSGKRMRIQNLLQQQPERFWTPACHRYAQAFAGRSQNDGIYIIVQKAISNKVSGKLFTSDLTIETDSKLNDIQLKELKTIGKKLKKHFYHPQEIDWASEKNIIYVTSIKPATNAQKAYLALIRHGESVWNAKGLWTGWTDIALSEKGHDDAKKAGEKLKDIHFDAAYTSALLRAQQTLGEIIKIKKQSDLPIIKNKALNERSYGDLTGKNKWEVEKQYGKEQFLKWRRGWDEPIPGGESLKDVYNRVIPYYENEILPKLKSGKNVIIAAHGNSLRSLVKYLESISDEDLAKLEIGVGEVSIYRIDEEGKVVSKEIRD